MALRVAVVEWPRSAHTILFVFRQILQRNSRAQPQECAQDL